VTRPLARHRFAAVLLSLTVVVASLGATDGAKDAAVPGDHVITPAGQRLARFLDATDVEHLWLPSEYVDWESGAATTRPAHGGVKSSHCSAYAAAVAEKLGVYLLRPPQHSQPLLANAQYTWLGKEGPAQGWKSVETPQAAQADANAGQLVVAVYRAPDPKKPGHIAVVHPAVKTEQELADKGPEITQAGATNYADTTVSVGFNHHPGAWDDAGKTVKFFAHDLPHDATAKAGDGK
jgi:hypothetical protein